MDGSYHITPVVPRTGSPAGPWSLDDMRAVHAAAAVENRPWRAVTVECGAGQRYSYLQDSGYGHIGHSSPPLIQLLSLLSLR